MLAFPSASSKHCSQKIAGHTTEGMTRNYQKGHEDVVWSEVEADLDIGDIAR